MEGRFRETEIDAMAHIYFVASCQTPSFDLLARTMLESNRIESTCYFGGANYRKEAVAATYESLRKADFILMQRDGFGPYAPEAIERAFPEKAILTLATIYFRGLHPDGCYVGNIFSKFHTPSPYHSLAVLEAFRQGRSESWAIKNAFTRDNFERLGLSNAWESSLRELAHLDARADFPIAPLIDRYCRSRQGFWTFNHPSLGLLHDYLLDVFIKMGLPAKPMDLTNAQDPLLEAHDICPIHDFVAEQAGLPYRTAQNWQLGPLGQTLDRETYIRASYEAYRRVDPQKLVVDTPPGLIEAVRASPHLCAMAPPSG